MRVALVLATATGGVGIHVRTLAAGLIEDGWAVRVCGPRSTEELFEFAALGAEFTPVEIAGAIRDPLAIHSLRRATADVDLVHAHGLRAATVAALSRRHPLVVTWHNLVLQPDGIKRRLLEVGERLVARRADVTLAASPDLLARVRALGGRDVRFAPVAPPVPSASRPVEAVRAELGVAPGQPLVVSVGRLHPQKAHDVLIRAATRWSDLDPVVVIAGDGPQRPELDELIGRTGAPVTLLGRRSDVADLLAAADVVVLASVWEARSLAAQEALQLGRPLVVTDVGGQRELVGDAAVVVAAGDEPELAAAVRALIESPERRAELGRRARAQAGTWPTDAENRRQIEDVYGELTDRQS